MNLRPHRQNAASCVAAWMRRESLCTNVESRRCRRDNRMLACLHSLKNYKQEQKIQEPRWPQSSRIPLLVHSCPCRSCSLRHCSKEVSLFIECFLLCRLVLLYFRFYFDFLAVLWYRAVF